MQLEIGKIYDGKVTGITKFGAFVEIDKDTTGMVHISEIANAFVNEIKDHIQEGQQVKVKVLSIGDDGKISLSIKKAIDNPHPSRPPFQKRENSNNNNHSNYHNNQPRQGMPPKRNFDKKAPAAPADPFEDMLNKFKQHSEEKISDLKKNMDGKRKNCSRHPGSKF